MKKIALASLFLLVTLSVWAQTKEATNLVSPKVFVVLDITVNDSILYEQYRINIEPVIQKYGGKYLVRSGGMAFESDPDQKIIQGEGNWNPNRLIIIEWDSIEELQKFTTSEEYEKIAQLRAKSATTESIIVKEYLKH